MTSGNQYRVLIATALGVLFLAATPAHAVLTHRYSFTSNASDSVGGLNWTVNGGAAFSGGQVVLDGVNDYLSVATSPLPTIAGSSSTIEVWGTYNPATANGSRLFDFTGSGLYLYFSPAATPGTPTAAPMPASNTRFRFEDGAGEIGPMLPGRSATGPQVLFTLVVDRVGDAMHLYREGGLLASTATAGRDVLSFLSTFTDFRLGHGTSAPIGGDLPAFLTGSVNEFRTYDSALTPAQILTNAINGPDVTNVTLTDKTWNIATGNWNTGGNWQPAGVPAAANRAVIGNAGTATVSAVSPATGAIAISNGTLSVGAGGSLQSTYPIELNPSDTNTATINITGGGRLITSGITNDGLAGAKTINVDGGTIQVGFASSIVAGPSATGAVPTAVVGAGGMTLDLGASSMVWEAALSGAGNVTKTGSGQLTLRGGTALTTNIRTDHNPNFTGEVIVNGGTIDTGQQTGVFGRGGTAGWGKVTLNNATMLVNTAGPGDSREFGMDIHVVGDNLVDNLNAGAAREMRMAGSLTGSGTLRFRKSGNPAAQGVDFQNPLPDPEVTNVGFTGRIVIEDDIAVRIRADMMDFPNAILELADPASWVGKRGPDLNGTIQIGGVAGVAGSRLEASIAGGGAVGNPPVTYELGFGGANVDFAGIVQDNNAIDFVSITKVGANTQTLSGPNTYSGPTSVNGGKLLVNGTHMINPTLLFAVGDYTVNVGGTLGGTGVIGTATDTIDVAVSGGNLAPGASVGTLTVDGNVNFSATSHFQIEVQGATADKLVVNALSIAAGATLDVTALGATTAGAHIIAEYDVGMLTGTFALNAPAGYTVSYATPGQIILNVPNSGVRPGDFNGDGSVNAADLAKWKTNFGGPGSDADGDNDSDGNDFLIWQRNIGLPAVSAAEAVPEPISWTFAVVVVPALAAIRRRGAMRL